MRTKFLIFIFSVTGGVLYSDIIETLLNAQWQFISISGIISLDGILGVCSALKSKSFKTSKTFTVLYKIGALNTLLAVVLSVEKGFPVASFLSEMIILPIIIFQLISIVKHLNLLKIISGPIADKILSNIDQHKNYSLNKNKSSSEFTEEIN